MTWLNNAKPYKEGNSPNHVMGSVHEVLQQSSSLNTGRVDLFRGTCERSPMQTLNLQLLRLLLQPLLLLFGAVAASASAKYTVPV
jgi:hypothetical protein